MVAQSQKPARVKKVHQERRRSGPAHANESSAGAFSDVMMSLAPRELVFVDPVINSAILASAKKDLSNEDPLSVEELLPQFEQPCYAKGRLILRKFVHRDIFTWYSSQNRKVPRDLVFAEEYLIKRDSIPIPPRTTSIFVKENRGAIYPALNNHFSTRDFSFGPENFNPRPITPPPVEMSESEDSLSPGLTSAGSPPSSISSVSSPEMESCKTLRVIKKRKSAVDIQRSLGVDNKKRINHRKSISDFVFDDEENVQSKNGVNRKLNESFKVAYVPLNDVGGDSDDGEEEEEEEMLSGSTATLTNQRLLQNARESRNKSRSSSQNNSRKNSMRSMSSGEATISNSSSIRRTRSKSLDASETRKLLPRISSLFANSSLKCSDEEKEELDSFDFSDSSPTNASVSRSSSTHYRQYASRYDAPPPMSHQRRTLHQQPHHNSVDAGIPPRVPPHGTLLTGSSIAGTSGAPQNYAPQSYARLAEMKLQSSSGAIGLGVCGAQAAPRPTINGSGYHSYTRKCSFKNKSKGHSHSEPPKVDGDVAVKVADDEQEDSLPRFMLPGYTEDKPLAVVNGSPKPKPRKKDFKFEEPFFPIPREHKPAGRGRLGRKILSCYDKINHHHAGGTRHFSDEWSSHYEARSVSGSYQPFSHHSSSPSTPRTELRSDHRPPVPKDLTPLCLLGRGDSLWDDRGKGFLARHTS
ncbi:hypothetical protein TRVA0_044S00760 [Trichomonascus vanleenenianus]|uniref:uncharacterized protein n=1 Tax=Trichomonascus vanleenenianus TaxID=2268995 RepID=UPI003ECB43A8